MTALALERLTKTAGQFPARGTVPIKANTRIFKGGIVGLDVAGRAMPGDTIANGCVKVIGKASATYDNRTGSALGGLADACDVEVEYGVFAYKSKTGGGDDISAVNVGSPAYVVDDATIALTNNTDTRAPAGFITEVRGGQVYIWMGPHVAGLIFSSAGEAAELDVAQTQIAALNVDRLTSNAERFVPLTSFVDADGDPLAKFISAGTPTFGFNLADGEAFGIRWNNDATPGTALTQIGLPHDLDDTAALEIEFLCSKSGATVGDATTLTVGAYLIGAGDLDDADVLVTGPTDALVGNAPAKTTKKLTFTIAAGDIQPGARSLTLNVAPTAGLLGTDDLILHDCRLRYTRKLETS